MDAIKTEYNKVVFDSKSEAVFAKTLDLAGHYWEYHPKQHCGHAWDFLVRRYWGWHSFRAYIPGFLTNKIPEILIEYKPSMPTNTYLDNLVEKMRSDPKESIVVWGNPWTPVDTSIDNINEDCCYQVYPIFCSYGKYGWGDWCRLADNGGDWPTSMRHDAWNVLGIRDEMVQKALKHRFDLARSQP